MEGNVKHGGARRPGSWRIAAWVAAALLLSLPLVAMQFTDEVNWSGPDFVFAGVLLFGSLGAYEIVARMTGSTAYRVGSGVALAAAFLLVWMNGAVEIIGDDNPANLMYFGVPLVGIAGAAMAGFRPDGMAGALFATALAQASVPLIALVFWSPQSTSWAPGVWRVFGLNAFFVVLFVASALFFRNAAKGAPAPGAA